RSPRSGVSGAGDGATGFDLVVEATGLNPTHVVQHLGQLSTGQIVVGAEGTCGVVAGDHAEVVGTADSLLTSGNGTVMHAGILGRVVDVQDVGHFFPVFLNPLMDFISVGEFIYGSDIVGTAACGKTGSPVVVDALPHGAKASTFGEVVNQTAGNTGFVDQRGFIFTQACATTRDHVFGQQNDCICTRGKCFITACGDRIVCVVNTG